MNNFKTFAKRIAKWGAVVATLFAILLSVGYWAAARYTATFTTRQFDHITSRWTDNFKAHKGRIQADLDLLVEMPIYTDLARIRNAEPVVRKYLTWDGDRSGSAPEGIEFENEKKIAAFLDRHALKNLTAKTWTSILEDPELETLKLTWLDDLGSYDHFKLSTHPSHVQAIEEAKHASSFDKIALASSLPYPRLNLFRAMATFRLAQLARDGNLEKGADLYRHISHLIWTQNSLVSAMTAMSMLSFEHELEKVLGSYPLPLVETERIEAMRSLAWLWGGAYRSLFVADFISPMKPYLTPETGACSGASESLAGVSSLSVFFEPTAYLEQDFTSNFKRAHTLEERLIRMCDFDAYRPFYEASPSETNPLFAKNLNLFVVDSKLEGLPLPNPARIPLIRRAAGAILMSVATPNAFSIYEKRERAPASK